MYAIGPLLIFFMFMIGAYVGYLIYKKAKNKKTQLTEQKNHLLDELIIDIQNGIR